MSKCIYCGHGEQTNCHELKTWPMHYSRIISGHKAFELRKNDRDFKVGDILKLCEWDFETKEYTGHWTFRKITGMMLKFPGLVDGYVLLEIGPA